MVIHAPRSRDAPCARLRVAAARLRQYTLQGGAKVPNRLIAVLVFLLILAAMTFTGFFTWGANQILAPLAPGKGDMPYARRMADTIVDSNR